MMMPKRKKDVKMTMKRTCRRKERICCWVLGWVGGQGWGGLKEDEKIEKRENR